MTGIKTDDIITTLQSLNLIKYWKGQHVISVSQMVITQLITHSSKRLRACKPGLLHWEPDPTLQKGRGGGNAWNGN